jgi:hypothetical protein
MSTLTISIPDSVRRQVESLAQSDGVSVESFINTILSQRIAIAEVDSYVQQRAARGSASQMLEILQKAPQVKPEPGDELKK